MHKISKLAKICDSLIIGKNNLIGDNVKNNGKCYYWK